MARHRVDAIVIGAGAVISMGVFIGASTKVVFTGQTVSRNGGPSAQTSQAVIVAAATSSERRASALSRRSPTTSGTQVAAWTWA